MESVVGYGVVLFDIHHLFTTYLFTAQTRTTNTNTGTWMSCACFGAVSTITGTWGIPCFTIPFCIVTMLVISSGGLEDVDDMKTKSSEEEKVAESKV